MKNLAGNVYVLPSGAENYDSDLMTLLKFALVVNLRVAEDEEGRERFVYSISEDSSNFSKLLSEDGEWEYSENGDSSRFQWETLEEAVQFAEGYVDEKRSTG